MTEVLNGAGHDALTVHGQRLSGADDATIAKRIIQESRCLITLDLGFGDIRIYPPKEYQGIIILRAKKQDKNTVLGFIHRLIPIFASETVAGRLWIVEEDRIRIRGDTE